MRLPTSRLFWKLFVAFWLAIVVAFLCGLVYVTVSGRPPPPGGLSRGAFIPIISGALVSIPFGLVLAWYLSHPLRHVSKALREAAGAKFDVRVLPLMGSRRDEIVDLAREFDRMAMRLHQATVQRQQLFHDVSHEFRSPLARIQAAIGLLQQNPQQPAAMIERIEREAHRLDALVEELLTLHRLEAGAAAPAPERVDLIELLGAIAQDAAFEAQTRGSTVALQAQGAFVTYVDGELIYRAVENVIRNAVKYTAPGSTVEIDARVVEEPGRNGSAARILEVSVCDRGPGVPAELCEQIFEPFRRFQPQARDSSGEPVPGTGLGLAIARRALALHGGNIRAMPRDGGGLKVVWRLPAHSQPENVRPAVSV